MMRYQSALVGALAIVAVAGCTNPYDPGQRALLGGLLGAAGGAISGSVTGGGRGAALGAIAGAATGAALGAATTPEPAPPFPYASPPSSAPRPDILGQWEFGRVSQGSLAGPGIPCHPILSNQPGQFGWLIFDKCNDNESFWEMNGENLLFVDDYGRTTTVFSMVNPDFWEGPYVKDPSWAVVHFLRRTTSGLLGGATATPLAVPVQNQLPGQITEAESLYHGTWTLNGPGSYLAVWDNAAAAQMTVVRFDRDAVVIDRADTPGSASAGMTAVYTGQISPDGNSVINTHVVWSWPGHPGFPTASGWSASW